MISEPSNPTEPYNSTEPSNTTVPTRPFSADYSLYLVTDRSLLPDGMSLTRCVEEAVRGGVTMVQLREKNTPIAEFLQIAGELTSQLQGTGVPLIINDRVDIALECGADGVHLGQSDLSPQEARHLLGADAIIGLSVESQEQLEHALHQPIDYIALSPIFSTPTKTNTIIEWGLEGIKLATSLTNIPIIAIGGLHLSNVASIVQSGASGVAVVSAICASQDPYIAAKNLREEISRHQTLASLGEFGLIRKIRRQFLNAPQEPLASPGTKTPHPNGASLQDSSSQSTSTLPQTPYGIGELGIGELGIGDDCAILPLNETEVQVITTDLLIEHKHFRSEWISAADLAYKSLAVSLSDISAMGAKPEYAFLSIGIPKSTPLQWIEEFFKETHEVCSAYKTALMGGDTTASDLLVINYTVLGRTQASDVLRRNGASPGERLMLLGEPGLSGAGLRLLMKGVHPHTQNTDEQTCIRQHHRPQLFTNEAVWLAQSGAVTSMIDLSDGLASDAGHLSVESEVALQIDIEKLPLPPALQRICVRFDWDPLPLMLASGEDYGLLFTVKSDQADSLAEKFERRFHRSLVWIGDVLPSTRNQKTTETAPKRPDEPELYYRKDGKLFEMSWSGFDHFLELQGATQPKE